VKEAAVVGTARDMGEKIRNRNWLIEIEEFDVNIPENGGAVANLEPHNTVARSVTNISRHAAISGEAGYERYKPSFHKHRFESLRFLTDMVDQSQYHSRLS
jgi:hypothetical protein